MADDIAFNTHGRGLNLSPDVCAGGFVKTNDLRQCLGHLVEQFVSLEVEEPIHVSRGIGLSRLVVHCPPPAAASLWFAVGSSSIGSAARARREPGGPSSPVCGAGTESCVGTAPGLPDVRSAECAEVGVAAGVGLVID